MATGLAREKSPRQYAFDFLMAKTDQEKKAAVEGCPKEWQHIVNNHVRLLREKMKR